MLCFSAVSFRPSRYQPDVKVRPLPGNALPEQRHLRLGRHRVLPLHLPIRLQGESRRKCSELRNLHLGSIQIHKTSSCTP